jgi:methyl-accepting chemotaxis protein
VIDLNSYGPIHNSDFCKDWTGVRDKDLVGNRIKRFFTDQRVLVRGARVGLPQAKDLPDRARRQDFVAAGCDLHASDDARRQFLVQTYARDTGAIITALTAPIFVKGERWGAVLLGWNA